MPLILPQSTTCSTLSLTSAEKCAGEINLESTSSKGGRGRERANRVQFQAMTGCIARPGDN